MRCRSKAGPLYRSILLISAIIFIAARASYASSRVDFFAVEKLFLEGKYDVVIRESAALIRAGSSKRDELYYLIALCELKTGKFKGARDSFNFIISQYTWSKRLFDARLGLGDSYLLEGEHRKALDIYNEIIRRYPKDKNIAIVYARLSACYTAIGDHNKVNQCMNIVKSLAPYSFEAKAVMAVQALPSRQKPEQIISPQPVSAPKGKCSVQVGSFKNKRNADRLARKLAGQGYDSYVVIPVSSDDKFYRVKVGHLNSKYDALCLSSRLISDGYRVTVCAEDVSE
jgi:tetratricopeptide (TPR) repeat protein